MAAVAALCVQYEADFRPNMSIVVKALQPLLNARHGPAGETPSSWKHLMLWARAFVHAMKGLSCEGLGILLDIVAYDSIID